MRYRKLSPTGDYTFGSSQLNFLRDTPETVAQLVQTTLKLFNGEWFLNIDSGVPYFEGVLGKHTKQEADLTIQDAILNVQGVTSLDNYSSSIDPVTRKYSATGTLNTIYGPTPLQVSNYGNF